jgi:hypothetical protein
MSALPSRAVPGTPDTGGGRKADRGIARQPPRSPRRADGACGRPKWSTCPGRRRSHRLGPVGFTRSSTTASSLIDQYADDGCDQHRTDRDVDRFNCVAVPHQNCANVTTTTQVADLHGLPNTRCNPSCRRAASVWRCAPEGWTGCHGRRLCCSTADTRLARYGIRL